MNKPEFIDGYVPEDVHRVQGVGRYIAGNLGDLSEHITVMGGLVPYLLIGDTVPPGVPLHIGTLDVDLGLILAHNDRQKLDATKSKLMSLGFKSDSPGSTTRMRYRDDRHEIIVDLMCGVAKGIATDFEEVTPNIAAQVSLAFEDRMEVQVRGPAIDGSEVDCTLGVCGPAAFILNKAITFRSRGENKDAYDLFYVAAYFGAGPASIFPDLARLIVSPHGQFGLSILETDFLDENGDGPQAVARFLTGNLDDYIQADVCGAITALLGPLGN